MEVLVLKFFLLSFPYFYELIVKKVNAEGGSLTEPG